MKNKLILIGLVTFSRVKQSYFGNSKVVHVLYAKMYEKLQKPGFTRNAIV